MIWHAAPDLRVPADRVAPAELTRRGGKVKFGSHRSVTGSKVKCLARGVSEAVLTGDLRGGGPR